MRSLTWVLTSAVALAACSSGGTASQAGETAARPAASLPAAAKSSRTVLLRTELTDVQQAEMDAYTAIRQLRPNMLTAPGGSSLGAPSATCPRCAYEGGGGQALTVFLNGNKQGGVEALRNIRMIEVEKIEHINGSEATQRFGTGYSGGAILVTRRK